MTRKRSTAAVEKEREWQQRHAKYLARDRALLPRNLTHMRSRVNLRPRCEQTHAAEDSPRKKSNCSQI